MNMEVVHECRCATEYFSEKEAHSDAAAHFKPGAGREGEPWRGLAKKFDPVDDKIEAEITADAGHYIVSNPFRFIVPDTDKTTRAIKKMKMSAPVEMDVPKPVYVDKKEIIQVVGQQNIGSYTAIFIKLKRQPGRVAGLKTNSKTG